MINSGSMRYIAEVFEPDAPDVLGSRPISAFASTNDKFRCSLQEQGVGERSIGNSIFTVTEYECRTRWHNPPSDLTTSHRLLVRGKMLSITGISNFSERDRVMIIKCEETKR